MPNPKMARLDRLSPEVRAMVEAELGQEAAEKRLRTLVFRNDRLIDAVADVGNFDRALDIVSSAVTDVMKERDEDPR